jgi:hypothetical protein
VSPAFDPQAPWLDAPWEGFLAAFRARIESASAALRALPESAAAVRPAPGKWSRKELLGHLIDSASNNHQRFVRAAFQPALVFAGYEQDAWVALQRYQDEPWLDLLELWRAYNRHLAHAAAALPIQLRLRPTREHNFDQIAWRPVAAGEALTLEWFVRDYAGHLEHHLARSSAEARQPGSGYGSISGSRSTCSASATRLM